jgi:ATP-dependent RNA helicase DbpA
MSKQVERILETLGITSLKPMQAAAIESIRKGGDLVLLSPTGSGKTLAFLLPVLEKLDPAVKGIQVLILAPSRELSLQIERVFRSMKSSFKVNCFYGGHPFKTERNNLDHPPALLIGTPGRIADHLRRGTFDTRSIKIIVLDEFDKALEFGFQEDMSFIISKLENLKQRILTSATQQDEIPEFTGIKNAKEISFLQSTPAKGLTLKKVVAKGKDKLEALSGLICKVGDKATLIFCNHRDAVDRISEVLRKGGLPHGVFHGGMEQEERERELIQFRNGSHRILITTDLASRGLDIPMVESVIHYQLPTTENPFIHRNGRTARMHAEGSAYLILGEDDYLPDYVEGDLPEEDVSNCTKWPSPSGWRTLYIGAGKKDKINKMDIVGFLLQKGGLEKDDLGLIEVLDRTAYVAVKSKKIEKLVRDTRDEKIKKRTVKIAVSY